MEEIEEELMFEMIPMRYTYYFNDEINSESVQEVIDILSIQPSVDLFITTPGGELSSMNVLIHFINNHPDIKLHLIGVIASAGTFLLTDCNKEIILDKDLDFILFHQGDRSVPGQFRYDPVDYKIMYEQLKETNDIWAEKFFKLGLTKKEIKLFLEGKDVVLYKKDFNRLKINKK